MIPASSTLAFLGSWKELYLSNSRNVLKIRSLGLCRHDFNQYGIDKNFRLIVEDCPDRQTDVAV